MARDNANEECRKAIDLLPMKKPSLNDMINACAKIGTAQHQMAMLTESVTTAVAEVIKMTCNCYSCGQPGHFISQCPHRTLSSGAANNKAAPGAVLCNRCGKPGHYVKQCKSHFQANGQPLKNQGNCRLNWRGQRVKTQTLPEPLHPEQVYVTGLPAEQKAQQGWMFAPPAQ